MFDSLDKEKKILLGCIAGSFAAYHIVRGICKVLREKEEEWLPVGLVRSLHIYPVNCSPSSALITVQSSENSRTGTFSSWTEPLEGSSARLDFFQKLLYFRFYTARQVPKLVLLKCSVDNEVLSIDGPKVGSISVDLKEVVNQNQITRASLFDNAKQDGLDCGDAVGQFLSDYMNETNVRLLMHRKGLYTERTCVPESSWWNNPVPRRKDDSGFTDLAPFHIATQASLEDLNRKLDKKVTTQSFRPSIVVEGCQKWDEDKWAEIRIGDAQLECVLTTVDPAEGVMKPDQQPLKKLREFRLAPEGPMRKTFKDSPVFGVYAGLKKKAYIHVGQPVYVRYKPTAFLKTNLLTL
ncbi:unnamed protein product [Caenorhabditis auriculariae]|uniref:MOSC domain-containing protein n=1 Tax=Caenorhabditis auriculariae TaxID=2777116 RepID=A0A8S1GVY9_9PELO|nr:unnamed protein product [Caenorhabditis auriculariae]